MKTFKIGMYKNGQQIAKEVFQDDDLNVIKEEFKRMFDATTEDCWETNVEQGYPENTVEGTTFEQAWDMKHFSEDTNNVAVFEVEENELLHTNYTYQGCKPNKMV